VNAALIGVVAAYAAALALSGDGLGLRPGDVAGQVRDVLWVAALCGLVAASLIEILKRLLHLRGVFQLHAVRRWLAERAEGDPFADLLRSLRVEGSAGTRMFDLPTEQLAAQVAMAADSALGPPHEMKALVAALAGPGAPSTQPASERQALELEQAVRTGVDQLQITIGERWRVAVQGAAVWLAGACAVALTHASGQSDAQTAQYVLAALVLGGPFAWLVRDAASVVERARR
jgi:hypothetical protein